MSSLPPFEHIAARSLAEATARLAEHGREAQLLAGGTDLLPGMKRGQRSARYLIGLGGIPELVEIRSPDGGDRNRVEVGSGGRGVGAGVGPGAGVGAGVGVGVGAGVGAGAAGAGGLVLGAMTPLARLVEDPLVRRRYPVVAEAAGLVGTPALRNMATLGGNLCLDTRCAFVNRSAFWRGASGYCLKLEGDVCQVAPGGDRCWAASSSDLAPVMMALGAAVRVVGADGERWLAVEDLYRDDGLAHLALAPDEVLAAVRLPAAAGTRACYLKLRPRAAFDFPSLGVAVALRLSSGRCAAVRIVVGAVASSPARVTAAEAELLGHPPTPERLAAAAAAVQEAVRPMDNVDMPPGYRRAMARVFTQRALGQALGTRLAVTAEIT